MTKKTTDKHNGDDMAFVNQLADDLKESYIRDKTVERLARDGALIPEKTTGFTQEVNAHTRWILARMERMLHHFRQEPPPPGGTDR